MELSRRKSRSYSRVSTGVEAAAGDGVIEGVRVGSVAGEGVWAGESADPGVH